MQIKNKVEELNQMILQGQIMEAMNRFYSQDITMAENDNPPTVGFEANFEREKAFVDHTTWYGLKLLDTVMDGETSMVKWFMDFHNTQYGKRLAFTQVAVQKWRDGKIYDERFYYSPQEVETP